MENIFYRFLLFLLLPLSGFGQKQAVKAFPLSAVRLLEGPFKSAQETDRQYMLALNMDKLLAPYLREAGLAPKEKSYGNWEGTGLDGHIGGHYLSALAKMYAATGDKEMMDRLNYMVDWLDKCQQKNGDGYVGGVPGGKTMWQDIAAGKIVAGSFSLNDKWVPWYNIHKLYAGLADAYLIAGHVKAKDILIKLSEWCINLTANLTNEQMQTMLRSEHGGMNEVFADVAAITGNEKYLQLARRFSHQAILQPLLKKQDALTGLHANTQIPKVIGYLRVAAVGGDTAWASAARFFWNTVVNNRTVSIGGNSVREHFHPATDFSSMLESKEGPETCNSYNMLKLTKGLFLSQPSVSLMDYYERTVYNHILSSQHPKGGFVYFTPMRPRHYRVYSQPEQGFWCCVGSGLENHTQYGEMIYAHNNKDLFINLFIPSTLQWKEKGLTLEQQTNFPFEETTRLTLNLKRAQKFKVYLRYPSWVKEGGMKVKVNGKDVAVKNNASYISIDREWKGGEVVSVTLPMQTKTERLPDNSSWVSFVHGPIVLAAATDTADLQGLRADDSRMGHIANGPLYAIEEAPVLVTASNDIAAGIKPLKSQPLTFTAFGLIYPEKYKHVKLVPFFQVHDARYIIYWPAVSPEALKERNENLRKGEEAKLAVAAQTVDEVAPGEQQPESDHNFKGEKTESGVFNDRHWRHATGWFSYDLKNPKGEARTLRVTYFGGDRNRTFDIYVNNTLLKTVQLDGTMGNKFFDVDYPLPQSILENAAGNNLNVKFVAGPGSTAGGIFYVRLLK